MQIRGKITKIIFNRDNFYIFAIKNTRISININNSDADIKVGNFVEVDGEFEETEKYGRTFKGVQIRNYEEKEGENLLPIYISNLGEKNAEKIVDSLGSNYLDILEENPLIIYDFMLSEKSKSLLSQWETHLDKLKLLTRPVLIEYIGKTFKGIGKQKAKEWIESIPGDINESICDKELVVKYIASDTTNKIYKQVKDISVIRNAHRELANMGYNEYFISRLIKNFKSEALSKIISNPYIPMEYGMTFQECDKIAMNEIGFEAESVHRVVFGVESVLKENEEDGNTFMIKEDAVKKSSKLLKIDDLEYINDLIDMNLSYVDDSKFALIEDRLYRRIVYFIERKVARKLKYKSNYAKNNISNNTLEYIDNNNFLTIEQKSALKNLLTNKLSILTGGPGTGKTTCVKALCKAIKMENKSFQLAAPTGRAAKRLSESTGFEAKTLHRLLEYKPRGLSGAFMRNEQYPLWTDYVIVDESSMVDVYMMNSLLNAIKDDTTLIFIGDADQLPSISMGSLFKDMKDSGLIQVNQLSLVHRQGEGSFIIKNANNIKDNKELELKRGTDFVFKHIQDFNEGFESIKRWVESGKNFQVLTPMKKGVLGTNSINELMQINLNGANPMKREIFAYDKLFREGDRVIQLENDYNKEVYNGEMGIIHKIKGDIVTVNFPDNNPEFIDYKKKDLKGLDLSYSISIHKSQGSEFDNVVMIVDDKNKNFLSKELIYTGITRSKKGLILMSVLEASEFSNLKTSNNRATSLKEFMAEI